MKPSILRQVGMLLLLALCLSPAVLRAQDAPVTVVGSGIVAPLFETLVTESGAQPNLDLSVTGTNGGFASFCAGEADVALANRPISVDEDILCGQNSVGYIELLAGHSIVAVVANPDSGFAQCLARSELNAILAPSSANQIVNWNQVNADYSDLALNVNLPGTDTPAYALVDSLIEGDGLREDVVTGSDEETLAAVSTTPGALGVVSLPAALAAGESVIVLEVDGGEGAGCAAPTAENVESRLYTAAERLFVYVNVESRDETGLSDALDFIASDEAANVVAAAGFTPPTESAFATNRDVLENMQSGRRFSREVSAFEIPQDVAGAVSVGGASNGFDYMQAVTAAFAEQYPGVAVDTTIEGEPAGFRRLCNGELDFALAYGALSEEQQANCDANNLTVVYFDLGARAAALVANGASDNLACLTTDQLATVWGSGSDEPVTRWNQVDASFPETNITLVAPQEGSSAADLLMIGLAGTAAPTRTDIAEYNDDPLYRAAAVANVEGGLTYMTWAEYQSVLDSEQVNIQLVGVDAGEGCVQPDEAAIAAGSYVLAQPLMLAVNQASLTRPEVQSLLWFMASDANYSLLQDAGLVGVSFSALPDLRDTLQAAFQEAAVQAAIRAEATPEATVEATAEATPAAATEATAEATDAGE